MRFVFGSDDRELHICRRIADALIKVFPNSYSVVNATSSNGSQVTAKNCFRAASPSPKRGDLWLECGSVMGSTLSSSISAHAEAGAPMISHRRFEFLERFGVTEDALPVEYAFMYSTVGQMLAAIADEMRVTRDFSLIDLLDDAGVKYRAGKTRVAKLLNGVDVVIPYDFWITAVLSGNFQATLAGLHPDVSAQEALDWLVESDASHRGRKRKGAVLSAAETNQAFLAPKRRITIGGDSSIVDFRDMGEVYAPLINAFSAFHKIPFLSCRKTTRGTHLVLGGFRSNADVSAFSRFVGHKTQIFIDYHHRRVTAEVADVR